MRRTLPRAAIAAIALVFSGAAAFAACAPGKVELRGDWGKAQFRVEIADTPAERGQGLMHRESMARSAGMLFIFENPHPVSFWMQNTLIPLDMLFIDETGTVSRIHREAVPLDTTPIPGGDTVQYVLEINGGMAEAMGITEGSELRHPRIAQSTAAWPCEE